MKQLLVLTLLCLQLAAIGQKIDSVDVPKGVVYKYASPELVEKAKALITKELGDISTYELDAGILFVGPVLWTRYQEIPSMAAIPGGNVTINFNKEKLSAKMTQDKDGFKKIWDQLRQEVKGKEITLRKATYKELQYYWAVISFDIDEPLLIAEAGDHRFILNLSPKTMKLVWLDEVPASMK
ncbi:MAG: hypothetical protein ABL876_02755 [Chitinophagaceae bacterium]